MSSAVCFNLDQSKILLSGNGLNPFLTHHCYFLVILLLSVLMISNETFYCLKIGIQILDWLRFKELADNKNDTYMMGFIQESVENIIAKVEKAGYQDFLLFPQCVHMPLL